MQGAAPASSGLASTSPFTPAPPGAASGGASAEAAGPTTVKTDMMNLNEIPTTYGEFSAKVVIDDALDKVLVALGVDGGTEMADIKAIAEEDWKEVLDKLVTEKVLSGALQRARAIRMIRGFLGKLGVDPPSLGAPLSTSTSSRSSVSTSSGAAAAPPQTVVVSAPPVVPADELNMISLRDFIDQGLKGSCQRLPSDTILAARAFYEQKVDHEPRDSCTPTPEQLSCLHALLRSGRPPYTDFGVWNVYGPRLARFQDFDAQIVVRGEVITKRIHAPSSLAGWTACWELFEVAMIALNAASVGALKSYSDGMKELATLFPDKWPILVTTDVIVRSERWSSIKERCDRTPPPGYDSARPWSYVIPASAWGSEDMRAQAWWQKMLVLPAATTSTVAQTANLVNALEGGAVPAGAAAFPMTADRQRRRSRTPVRLTEAPRGKGVCRDYNLRSGRCRDPGPCPFGRSHTCAVCGDVHRGLHHHKQAVVLEALGMTAEKPDKGKGKGKKGKKGKKGESKGDFDKNKE